VNHTTRQALMGAAESRARDHPAVVGNAVQQGVRRYRARIAGAYLSVFVVTALVLAALLIARPAVATLLAGPRITGITLTPASMTMVLDEERALSAAATYSDGSTGSVPDAVWTSSNSDVAIVSSGGTVTARAAGTVIITAESGEQQGTAAVTVTAVTLANISLTPNSVALGPGEDVQLTAEGTYSDGTVRALTTEVTWTSSASTVASVDSTGRVTAHIPGAAIITAAEGILQSTALVTVIQPVTLVDIALEPENVTLEPKQTQQLTVMGQYSDGTTRPLSAATTWKSSNTKVAQVDDAGLVTAIEAGHEATITASANGFTATATITVVTPRPISITITAADKAFQADLADDARAAIRTDEKVQLFAVGTFRDGTTQTLEGVEWASSEPTVAEVDANGVLVTIAKGTTVITATVGALTGQATIDVFEQIVE
jgi:uncharacterized protein YjdB